MALIATVMMPTAFLLCAAPADAVTCVVGETYCVGVGQFGCVASFQTQKWGWPEAVVVCVPLLGGSNGLCTVSGSLVAAGCVWIGHNGCVAGVMPLGHPLPENYVDLICF